MTSETAHDETADDRADPRSPLRTCAVTRRELPKSRLLRFVAAPDDTMVVDLAARLPGRGVWITATRAAVEKAIKQNAFARSLKRPVTCSTDTADRIEQLLLQRLREAFSFARKAGAVITGFAKVEAAAGDGNAIALIHASDGAADGASKLDRKFTAVRTAAGKPVLILAPLTCAEMSLAIGRDNVVHAALIESGASRKVLSLTERLRRYRLSDDTENSNDPQSAATPPCAKTDLA